MARTVIQLEDEQYRRLKQLARERNKSMSALIREGIDLVIGGVMSDEDKKKRALEVVGRHHSGIRDLAKDHDRYLEEEA